MDGFEFVQPKHVNVGDFMNLLRGISQFESLRNSIYAAMCSITEGSLDVVISLPERTRPESLNFEIRDHAHSLLHGLFPRATNGHHLANRLHARPELRFHQREFVKVPAWKLRYTVVQSRLK